MRTASGLAAVVLLALVTVGAPARAGEALLGRGGFDSAQCDRIFCQVDVGGTRIAPWSVTRGSVDLVPDTYWQSQSGRFSLDLAGGGTSPAGTVQQAVSTAPGANYLLTFWFAGNPECGPALKRLQVTWGDTVIASPAMVTTGRSVTDMGWVKRGIRVTATGTSTVVAFSDATRGGGPCGATLDNVRLTPLFGGTGS